MTRIRRFIVALSLMLCAGAAFAEIPASRDEFQMNARTVLAIVGMSLLGGLVRWINKVRTGATAVWNLMQLVGELCTSAFAGLICYLLCDSFGMNVKMTICLVGISGHMGTRAIAAFEDFAEKRWGAIAGPGQEPRP